MLSSVLSSARAIQMNILIIRAFITLREMRATHTDLSRKIDEFDRKQQEHGEQLAAVCSIVNDLIETPETPKRRIGFGAADQN